MTGLMVFDLHGRKLLSFAHGQGVAWAHSYLKEVQSQERNAISPDKGEKSHPLLIGTYHFAQSSYCCLWQVLLSMTTGWRLATNGFHDVMSTHG